MCSVCAHGVDSRLLVRGLFQLFVGLLVALALLALAGFPDCNPEFLLLVVGVLPAATTHILHNHHFNAPASRAWHT